MGSGKAFALHKEEVIFKIERGGKTKKAATRGSGFILLFTLLLFVNA
jgi:hypothetical protein